MPAKNITAVLLSLVALCGGLSKAAVLLSLVALCGGLSKAQAARLPVSGGSVIKDITYLAPDRSEKMDFYRPDGCEDHTLPCLLYIHGGGWRTGDKYQELFFSKLCAPLLKEKIAVASINYNMTRKPLWPQNLDDCKTAVRFLKEHASEFGIDPNLIVVSGTSAGGHLALMTVLTPNDPDMDSDLDNSVSSGVAGCVDFCGITDVRRVMPMHKPKRWGNILFDGSPDTVSDSENNPVFPAIWKVASPIFNIHADSVPLLLVHGTADKIVEPDHAEQLHNLLKAAGNSSALLLVEGAEHGITLCTPEVMEKIAAFIQSICSAD